MPELVGLIPAAGRGVRAYPYTNTIPKSMLEIDGVPVLQRNVELLRDQLQIRDMRIVVGHQGHVIREYFGDGGRFGVRITYVDNDRLDLELAYSIYIGSRDIRSYCCVVLADECYVGTNHRALLDTPYRDALATLCFIETDYVKHIRKNYVATFEDGRVTDLHEKPATVTGRLMGTGTYLLSSEVFRRLGDAFAPDVEQGPRDWTSWLATLCREDARVVTLSSGAHRIGRIAFGNLGGEHHYFRWRAYGQSKLANLLFALELERRLSAVGSTIRSMAAHPGYAATNLQFAAPPLVDRVVMQVINPVVAHSEEMGALPILYAATEPGLPGGTYAGPDGLAEQRGHPQPVAPNRAARDEAVAKRLWDVSEEMTGVHYELGAGAAA